MNGMPAIFNLLCFACSAGVAHRKCIAIGVGLELGAIALTTASPFLLKRLIDNLAAGHAPTPSSFILVIVFVVSWSAPGWLSNLRLPQSAHVTAAVARHLTIGLLRHALPMAAGERSRSAAHLTGMIERLPYSLSVVLDGVIWSSVPLVVQLLASLACALGVLPLHEVVLLGCVLAVFAADSWLGAARHQKCALAANAAAAQGSQIIGDIVRNGRRVVLNGNLDGEIALIDTTLAQKGKTQIGSAWSLARMTSLQFVTLAIGLSLLMALALRDIGAGRLSVGGLVLLQAYALRILLPLGSFGFIFSHAGEALANIAEVMHQQAATLTMDAHGPALSPLSPASVRVDDVHFAFGAAEPALAGLSFALPPGSFTAVVGANGSGKSTLAQLLAGILTPTAGAITISGLNVHALQPVERHRLALYVPQSIGLFNRTLLENALYPPSDLSRDALRARLAEWAFDEAGRATDFDAVVGELGERLSGGQIQKLELARLCGVRVPLMILDESTSALDPASEARIVDALKRELAGRSTLVLITHRATSAALADQVLWLSGGTLAAVGDHAELLRTHPGYRRLWNAP